MPRSIAQCVHCNQAGQTLAVTDLVHLDLGWFAVAERTNFASCCLTLIHFPAAAADLRVVLGWWELALAPAAQLSAQSRAENAILHWSSAFARRLDAQLLGNVAEERASIRLNAIASNTRTEEVVKPELIIEACGPVEERGLPPFGASTSEFLVAANACWRALDLRECTLISDAATDTQARAEWIAEASHLASLVNAQVAGLRAEEWFSDGANSAATAAAVLEPPCIREHLLLVEVGMDLGFLNLSHS